jgi:hypothetical protein
VQRILQRVQNPHLQHDLVDEVQQGEDLSNADASKVYHLDIEPGIGLIKRIQITAHAQYRMDLRGVSVQDVQDVLKHFVTQLNNWKALKSPAYERMLSTLGSGDKIEWVNPKTGLKIVFATIGPGTVDLITTFNKWHNSSVFSNGVDMYSDLVLRVAARFMDPSIVTADDRGVWLPDMLGSKENLVKEILLAAKKMAAADTFKKGDIKSICGGVLYFLMEEKAGKAVADKLWNLLDSSAGLDVGAAINKLVWRITPHLDHGDKGKVQAAAVGISLLQRSKQPTKAQRANVILRDALKSSIDMAGPPEEKGKTPTAKDTFLQMVKDQIPFAKTLYGQIKDPGVAALVVSYALDQANYSEASSFAESTLKSIATKNPPDDVVQDFGGQVSDEISFAVYETAAFGVALMQEAGQASAARTLFTGFLRIIGPAIGPGNLL